MSSVHATSSPTTREIRGGAIVWDDLQGNLSLARVPAAAAPTWDNITIDGFTFKLLSFATDDYVDITVQTSHAAQLSSLIENHIHWTIAADEVGDHIAWELTGIAAGIGEAFASIGTITSADYIMQANDAGKHNFFDIGDLDSLNTTVSSIFVIRLKRVAPASGVDVTAKIGIFFDDSHVRKDTVGSLEEDSKI